jgi:hypothetical protein
MVNVPPQVIDIQYPYATSPQVKQTDVKICSTILLMVYRHYTPAGGMRTAGMNVLACRHKKTT